MQKPGATYVGRGAGSYNNLLMVEKNNPVENPDGQQKPKWDNAGKQWAMIVPRGGDERRIFEQLNADVNYLVRLRYSKDTQNIRPESHRFVTSDGMILNIDSRINVDTRNFEFEYRCIEWVKK